MSGFSEGFPWVYSTKVFGWWWDVDGSRIEPSDLDMIELGFKWPT